jgi:ATP-dependent helicase/nuclease subunit A
MIDFDPATLAQIRAANPTKNTWVSANAGSGKTRVLTDRVARLLLHDTDPQRILCLTYTKAAAAEMQNRLFKRLGEWAMAPNETLRHDLTKLGEDPAFLTEQKLAQARTLFAAALETPGGLKIQTIHAFCDALLRRFPLEAGVAPQFNVLEDRQATQLRAEIVEQMASRGDVGAVDALAKYFTRMDTDDLTREIVQKRAGFLTPPDLSDFNVKEGVTIAQLHSEIIEPFGAIIAQFVKLMAAGSANDVKAAQKLQPVLNGSTPNQDMRALESVFLTGKTAKAGPFSAKSNIATAKTIPKTDPLYELQLQIASAIETRRAARLAINAFDRTSALHTFATAFLAAYDKRKAFSALLDYDDLIHLSAQLLTQGAMAQWVLYRLDGGLDHILVDEAQDTSPAQWAVIDCLAREFTYGASANDRPRSLFVVGDEKQSIYSFQGADPVVFGQKKTEFGTLLGHIEQSLADRELLHSFRSASPILNLVDTVFSGAAGTGMNSAKHIAFHGNKPGRVDLWPFIEKEPTPEKEVWYRPVDLPAPNDPKRKLATRIAKNIHALLESGQEIEVEGITRPVAAGDILILVQGRSDLFHAILKELKSLNLPVAGADRLNVGEELAVRDILSLLQFATMADDDLSLAEAMRSPLLGFSEAELFNVAHGRKGTLWQSLRDRTEFNTALCIINDMRKQVDYLRPYELIERLLIKHKGRENLLARLGLEIEDGIDELLSQAMQYESLETPTLTGFLHWFVSGKVEIKRDMGDVNQIRIMTVHGAKGLEAPIVILPDTSRRPRPNSDQVTITNDLAIWRATGGEGSTQQNEAEALAKTNDEAERMRLLYVALTRAESWLIICGAGEKPSDTSWYSLASDAMGVCGATEANFDKIGAGMTLQNDAWAGLRQVAVSPETNTIEPSTPDWLKTMAPKIARPLQPIAPSKLAGSKALPNDDALPEEDAKRRGRHLHKLLEYMPNQPTDTWVQYGQSLLNGETDAPDQNQTTELIEEAIALLANPDLHHIFFDPNSMAEVGITAPLEPLGRDMMGYIDRLIISDSTVLVVDFKSNVGIPATVQQTPKGILAQQGAYLLALQQIYPDHVIDIAVLWTRTGEIMSIPHNIAIDALNVPQHLDDSGDHS